MGKEDLLFREMNTARYGDSRRRRRLFLPKLLGGESRDKRVVDNGPFEKAHEIICKWAKLESSGKLQTRKETNIEGEFLTEVFGEVLGYTFFSKNKERWDIEPKYNVNGGEADAAIGLFGQNKKTPPRVVIELKGPKVNVDRDKFNGRTAVQQCWDYLNDLPECPWGIVCNFVSFRLYHRRQTPKVYELFTLQDLRKNEVFRRFYYIFQREGLLPTTVSQMPRADVLLERSTHQEKEVGDRLYQYYRDNRTDLIRYLQGEPHNKPLEQAIRIAQKLLDRVIFIAFCEDRELLPRETLKKAWADVPPFARVTNPRWKNFLNLFESIDKGNPEAEICAYNGGLFRRDDEVDNLEIDDDITKFFKNIGEYDFRDEINVDVLGHLFERSVHDIERIRSGGLFAEAGPTPEKVRMSRSAERKKFGIYYTPSDFTEFIVQNTVGRIADERFEALAQKLGVKREETEWGVRDKKTVEYWEGCLGILRDIRIVDPACGSGAFLIKAYELLEELYLDIIEHLEFQGKDVKSIKGQVADIILNENIYGVDLSPEAVEITQLALWIRSADKGKTLSDLSHNIVCGNSLVSDTEVHAGAMEWKESFGQVFSREKGGFDCVIGNPPWERIKLQEREFFDGRDSEIATAVSAAKRRKLIEKLKNKNLELYELYSQALKQTEVNLQHVRKSGRYPLMGKGDINTYAVFAELAHTIVGTDGLVGLLVPSGIATDKTTKDFFGRLVESKALFGLYDFENRKKIFTDVDGRFKFSILLFSSSGRKNEKVDFVFFAHRMEELKDNDRHISLSPEDIKLMNPNTRTCPVFRSNRDAQITREIYHRVPVFHDRTREEGCNPWGIKFVTMFHQTNDAELFHTSEDLKKQRYKRVGPNWKKGKRIFLPLYEAKMIQMYDHRAASVVVNEENWMRQGQTVGTSPVEHQNPEYIVEPRWWVANSEVVNTYKKETDFLIGFKDITSPTNQRTVIASAIPFSAATNHFVLVDSSTDVCLQLCLLANLNSIVFDYIARQKIGGVTLNFFIVEQLPILSPDFYDDECPWRKKQALEKWVSDRVLKLTCTSNDMIPLAEAAGFAPVVHKWKEAERERLMAELDAAYFILYGIKRNDVKYILTTFRGIGKERESLLDGCGTVNQILKYYDEFR